jgi:hypothetical protein
MRQRSNIIRESDGSGAMASALSSGIRFSLVNFGALLWSLSPDLIWMRSQSGPPRLMLAPSPFHTHDCYVWGHAVLRVRR